VAGGTVGRQGARSERGRACRGEVSGRASTRQTNPRDRGAQGGRDTGAEWVDPAGVEGRTDLQRYEWHVELSEGVHVTHEQGAASQLLQALGRQPAAQQDVAPAAVHCNLLVVGDHGVDALGYRADEVDDMHVAFGRALARPRVDVVDQRQLARLHQLTHAARAREYAPSHVIQQQRGGRVRDGEALQGTQDAGPRKVSERAARHSWQLGAAGSLCTRARCGGRGLAGARSLRLGTCCGRNMRNALCR
jgi:hypothetical protein